MFKNKTYLIIFLIFLLSFFTANLVYPKYLNQGIDYINNFQYKIFNYQIKTPFKIPYFWEIPFKLGLDLQGGAHLLYEADLSNIKNEEKRNAMEGLKNVIERRINYFGIQEPVIQIQKDRLIVEIASKDPAAAIKEIGKTPILEFKEQKPEEQIKKIEEKQKEIEGKTFEEIQQIDNWTLAFESPFQSTLLTGQHLKRAELTWNQTTYKPEISLEFNEQGAKIFEELTNKNIGKPLAIYIDQTLLSAPNVQEKITGGKAQITGNFTVEEAKKLVINLNAGALPVPIKLISQENVGPILGKISLEQSLRAGIFGFLIVILFMIIFYRLPGILASLALGIYVLLILALFKLIPVTLTLAGIAGFILSIGMAVDANILIFSRMREEMREEGKNFSIILEQGFQRAWPSIRDSNLNTILVSLILFAFGTSFVKGFAFTLILGVIISMFSAIFITNNFLKIFINTRFEKIKWLWK